MWWEKWVSTQTHPNTHFVSNNNASLWFLFCFCFSGCPAGDVCHRLHRKRWNQVRDREHGLGWRGSRSALPADPLRPFPGTPSKLQSLPPAGETETNRAVNDLQLATPSPTLGRTKPAVGLKVGSTVNGRFNGEVQSVSSLKKTTVKKKKRFFFLVILIKQHGSLTPCQVTSLGLSAAGECSSDLSRRMPILFTHNTISGCKFTWANFICLLFRLWSNQVFSYFVPPWMFFLNFSPCVV